jgi:hypothetical protein
VSADQTKDREERDEDEGEADPMEADAADTVKRADESDESDESDEETSWAEKARLAQRLWDAGDNARLRGVLDELEKAPPEQAEARVLAADLRRRLKPDPVAIGLWVVTFLVFCLLTYLFVLK